MIHKSLNHDLIVVILQARSLTCAHLEPGSYKPYKLTRLATTHYPTTLTHNGTLIPTTWIGAEITRFIKKQQLHTKIISIVCDEAIIMQGYATTLHASAEEYITRNFTLPHHRLDTLYVCPYQDRFLHWWSRSAYGLLLQLQLLAYRHHFNIIRLIPAFPALLELYTHLQGTSFRAVRLAADLEKGGYDLAACIEPTTLHRLAEGLYHQTVDNRVLMMLIGAALYEGNTP